MKTIILPIFALLFSKPTFASVNPFTEFVGKYNVACKRVCRVSLEEKDKCERVESVEVIKDSEDLIRFKEFDKTGTLLEERTFSKSENGDFYLDNNYGVHTAIYDVTYSLAADPAPWSVRERINLQHHNNGNPTEYHFWHYKNLYQPGLIYYPYPYYPYGESKREFCLKKQ